MRQRCSNRVLCVDDQDFVPQLRIRVRLRFEVDALSRKLQYSRVYWKCRLESSVYILLKRKCTREVSSVGGYFKNRIGSSRVHFPPPNWILVIQTVNVHFFLDLIFGCRTLLLLRFQYTLSLLHGFMFWFTQLP